MLQKGKVHTVRRAIHTFSVNEIVRAKICFILYRQNNFIFRAKKKKKKQRKKKGKGGKNRLVIFCVVVKRNIITVPNYPKRRERK